MKQPLMFLLVFAATLSAAGPLLCAAESDAKIDRAFRQTHVYRVYLKDDRIATEGQEGVITLTGTVAREFHKTLAQETVAGLPGVIRVDNRLEVLGARAVTNSDERIREHVWGLLVTLRSVNPAGTEIEVSNGCVTLRGQALSITQRDLTTQFAKVVKGVKAVSNEMRVDDSPIPCLAPANPKIDDASIHALVKLALCCQGSSCALSNEVKTRDGVVWLSGQAQDLATQEMVATLLTDIYGVTSVMDTHDGVALYGYYEEPEAPGPDPREGLAGND